MRSLALRTSLAAALLALLLVLAGSTAGSTPAEARAAPAAAADTTEGVAAFFERFVAAVRAGDAGGVADLARFPIAGAEVDRAAFLSTFYPAYLGEHERSFRAVVVAATPADLEPLGDGRYRYMALVSECLEDAPDECYESAMLFYFVPDGDSWALTEIQFAG